MDLLHDFIGLFSLAITTRLVDERCRDSYARVCIQIELLIHCDASSDSDQQASHDRYQNAFPDDRAA